MPRIRVDPEELREIARQIAQASANLQESRNRVQQNWGRLDASGWYGAHRARVESRWGSCQSQIATVAAQLFDLSQWLYESAAALEEADRASSQDIARLDSLVERFRNAVEYGRRLLERLSLEAREALAQVLRLGGIIGGIILPTLPVIRFPIIKPPAIVWPPRIAIPDWLIPLLPKPAGGDEGVEPFPSDTKITLPDGRQLTLEELRQMYPGNRPDPGLVTKDPKYKLLVTPAVTSDISNRNPDLYSVVIDQFAVGVNTRYQARGDRTFCNIFVWDVMKAMGAEIPHLEKDASGKTTDYRDANEMVCWLPQRPGEAKNGWRKVTAEEAQRYANMGKPAVAGWQNPGGSGHVAVVRPGTYDPAKGPAIAQAGAVNYNDAHVADGFREVPSEQIGYWVHD